MPDDKPKASDAKSMWRPVSAADLQVQGASDGQQAAPGQATSIGPDTRSLYRRVADWATRPTTEFQGTIDRPGFTPLQYGERGLLASAVAAGAPELGAATGALKVGKEALTRAPGALGGAAYGGRLASEVGLPKWSGQAIGGVGGFFAPEVLAKTGGPLMSRLARMMGKSAPEAAAATGAGEAAAAAPKPGAPTGEPSRILTLQQAAEQGGTASAAGGAPAWESQAYTPEAQRLIQKLQQQGGRESELEMLRRGVGPPNPSVKSIQRQFRGRQ